MMATEPSRFVEGRTVPQACDTVAVSEKDEDSVMDGRFPPFPRAEVRG
jgi:hypothetical protein